MLARSGWLALACLLWFSPAIAGMPAPVWIGLDLELRDVTSTSDDAVQFGAQRAVDEINARGGVLNGRPLKLAVKDNRSVPQRGTHNIRDFAAMPDLVAFLTGKFSPVALEQAPLLPELRLIMLDPWAAADGIVANGQDPNWAFRLSMNDSMAVQAVLAEAKRRGYRRVGALLPNFGWGRSNHEALKRYLPRTAGMKLVGVEWYNLGGEPVLVDRYQALRSKGAEVVFMVANEPDGAHFVREIAQLPDQEKLPVISHWGITGGDFFKLAGAGLRQVDLSVVQTYSFGKARNGRAAALRDAALKHFGVNHAERIPSPVGIAHAYDIVHLLAMAINRAGTTDRRAVRSALEHLPAYDGVVKHWPSPFTTKRHEALAPGDLFFSRYVDDGRLVAIP